MFQALRIGLKPFAPRSISRLGAWAKHYIPGARGVTIPNADIVDEYNKRTA